MDSMSGFTSASAAEAPTKRTKTDLDRKDKKDRKERESRSGSGPIGEGDRIIAALNESLGGQIRTVKNEVIKVTKNVEDLRTETRTEFTKVNEKITNVEAKQLGDSNRIDKLEEVMKNGAARSSGEGPTIGRKRAGQTRLNEQHLLLIGRRRVIFVVGAGQQIDGSEIKSHLRE